MAGATYKRVMVEIDSVKFFPMEAKYALTRQANNVGRRVGESLVGRAYVWVDASQIDNISQAHQIELWKMATECKDPLHKVSITYYLDDNDKVLANVEFMGWLSVFQYTNPKIANVPGGGGSFGTADVGATASVSFANLLYLELAVVLDEANVAKHKFTK
jgi:hypothetical protein